MIPFLSRNSQGGLALKRLLGVISGSGAAQNLKIAAQFSTKLHNFLYQFGVEIRSGGLALKTSLGDISGRDATQNLKITAQFSTKSAQFFDTILSHNSLWGAGSQNVLGDNNISIK